MDLITWILIIICWIAILRYRFQIYEFTGEWGWANAYLWGNGTIVAISLIGMILIAVGTAYPFWVIDFAPVSDTSPMIQMR